MCAGISTRRFKDSKWGSDRGQTQVARLRQKAPLGSGGVKDFSHLSLLIPIVKFRCQTSIADAASFP